jgi:hypothetical protein
VRRDSIDAIGVVEVRCGAMSEVVLQSADPLLIERGPSIMSYATPHATFLSGDGFPPEGINPSSLCEADGLGSGITDLSFITSSLGGIPVDSPGRRVDWNRDASFSGTALTGGATRCRPGERVRAVINWGYNGCDAHPQGAIVLSTQTAAAGRTLACTSQDLSWLLPSSPP